MADRLTELLETVDAALAEQEVVKAEALALVADNPWCVTALRRRGIEVAA